MYGVQIAKQATVAELKVPGVHKRSSSALRRVCASCCLEVNRTRCSCVKSGRIDYSRYADHEAACMTRCRRCSRMTFRSIAFSPGTKYGCTRFATLLAIQHVFDDLQVPVLAENDAEERKAREAREGKNVSHGAHACACQLQSIPQRRGSAYRSRLRPETRNWQTLRRA